MAAVRLASRAVAQGRAEGLISPLETFPYTVPRLLKLQADQGPPVPAEVDASVRGSGRGVMPSGRMVQVEHPAPGSLLLAHPRMPDPRFARTAVLVLGWHPKAGATGVTINPDALLTRLPPLALAGVPANAQARAAAEAAQAPLRPAGTADGKSSPLALPVEAVAESILRLAELRLAAALQQQQVMPAGAAEGVGEMAAARWAIPPNARLGSALPALFPPHLRVAMEGPVPTRRAAQEAQQVADAVRAAQRGVVDEETLPAPKPTRPGVWESLVAWLRSLRSSTASEPAPDRPSDPQTGPTAPADLASQLQPVSVVPGGPVPDFYLLHAAAGLAEAVVAAEVPTVGRVGQPPRSGPESVGLAERVETLRQAARALEQRALGEVGTATGTAPPTPQLFRPERGEPVGHGRRRRKPICRPRTRAEAIVAAGASAAQPDPTPVSVAAAGTSPGNCAQGQSVTRLAVSRQPASIVAAAERALRGHTGPAALQGGEAVAFEGVCHWAAGQLDAEVASGSWIVVCADDVWGIVRQGAGVPTTAGTVELLGGPGHPESQAGGMCDADESAATAAYGQELWASLLASLGGEYAAVARDAMRSADGQVGATQQAGHSPGRAGGEVALQGQMRLLEELERKLEIEPPSDTAAASAAVRVRREGEQAGLVWSDTEDEVADLLDDAVAWQGTAYGAAVRTSLEAAAAELDDDSDDFADQQLHNLLTEDDLDDDVGTRLRRGAIESATSGSAARLLPGDARAIEQLLADQMLSESDSSSDEESGSDTRLSRRVPDARGVTIVPSGAGAGALTSLGEDTDSDSDMDSEAEEMAQRFVSQLEERIAAVAEARAVEELSAEATTLPAFSLRGEQSGRRNRVRGGGQSTDMDDPMTLVGAEAFGTARAAVAAGDVPSLPRSALAMRLAPSWYERDLDEHGRAIREPSPSQQVPKAASAVAESDVFLNAGRRASRGRASVAQAASLSLLTGSVGDTDSADSVELLEERYPRIMEQRRLRKQNSSIVDALKASGLSPTVAETIVEHFNDDTLGHLRTALQAADDGDEVGFAIGMQRAQEAIAGMPQRSGAAERDAPGGRRMPDAETASDGSYVMTAEGIQPVNTPKATNSTSPGEASAGSTSSSDEDPAAARR